MNGNRSKQLLSEAKKIIAQVGPELSGEKKEIAIKKMYKKLKKR